MEWNTFTVSSILNDIFTGFRILGWQLLLSALYNLIPLYSGLHCFWKKKKSTLIRVVIHLDRIVIFLWLLSRPPLSLWFQQVHSHVLGAIVFVFILCRVCWASVICGFLSFQLHIILSSSSNIFSLLLFLSFPSKLLSHLCWRDRYCPKDYETLFMFYFNNFSVPQIKQLIDPFF